MARPRKPTVLHLIDGTSRPARSNPNEPQRPLGAPEPPSYLSRSERAAWDRFAALLLDMKVLTADYWAALEQLACAYSEAQELRAVLRKKGRTYETKSENGSVMIRPRPEVALLRAAERTQLTLLGRFGLTPSDRPNVAAGPDPERNADDEFR